MLMNILGAFDDNRSMASQDSPLGGVVEWFLGRVSDRRQYRRRVGSFHLWWHPDANTARPGVGTEISANGLVFATEDVIRSDEFGITIRLREEKIPIRVKRLRHDTFKHRDKDWNRYSVTYQGIAADDWDAIVRFVNDEPELPDRRKMQNQELSAQVDDAYRLLPMAVQQKIIDLLVAQHKLEAPKPGQTPLLKLFYGGLITQPGERKAHRFNVHSRIIINDEPIAHDSRFLIFDDGTIVQQ